MRRRVHSPMVWERGDRSFVLQIDRQHLRALDPDTDSTCNLTFWWDERSFRMRGFAYVYEEAVNYFDFEIHTVMEVIFLTRVSIQ